MKNCSNCKWMNKDGTSCNGPFQNKEDCLSRKFTNSSDYLEKELDNVMVTYIEIYFKEVNEKYVEVRAHITKDKEPSYSKFLTILPKELLNNEWVHPGICDIVRNILAEDITPNFIVRYTDEY
jgi:hypothetical protein